MVKDLLTSMFNTTWDLITPENVAQALGALASILALIISLTHITQHWRYNRTKIRKSTVRLLFVVPIFALDCWACLMLEASQYDWAELLTCVREVYEAVALVSFMDLMLTILGGTAQVAKQLERRAELGHHGTEKQSLPIRVLFSRYKVGGELLGVVLWGIFQYVFCSIAYLLLITIIWALDRAHMVSSPAHGVLRILPNVLKALSCGWALTCLLLFAHLVKDLVPSCGLTGKFLSIKGIVFFTFWQGFAIWVLQRTGEFAIFQSWVTGKAEHAGMDTQWWDDTEVKSGLNDFLLCFEVLFFSILHIFAYPVREFNGMPQEVQDRIILEEATEGADVERIVSVVNLLNIVDLHDDILALSENSPHGAKGVDEPPTSWLMSRSVVAPIEERPHSGDLSVPLLPA